MNFKTFQVWNERLIVQLVLHGQLVHPSLVPRPHLVPADHYEDAGEPVRDEDEADHQQAEDDCAVLGKPLNLLKNPRQSDQSC